jgi:glutathione peroxidase
MASKGHPLSAAPLLQILSTACGTIRSNHAAALDSRLAARSRVMSSIYDFEAMSIDGKPAHLGTQRGKVLLIVNTASACGFTPQFAGLEELWKAYADKGLVVVGFPSNEFGGQDPGANEEIASFCQLNYGVDFPMMAKVEVNGANAHPLWKWLTSEAPGLLGSKAVKWNFTKFLVGRNGQVIKRYAPTDTPAALKKDIEAALAAKA